MSLLRFFNAAGQTLRGLPENQLVMGGLGLMSANQPGQAAPVDQPGSFLKGMLSANALRQNRLLQEEKAKEKERQEAQRVAADQFFQNVAIRPQMVADRNLALQMQQQQELAQMQTPFNAADMRATLPADMQARSIGDAGPQTAIHTASPIDVPPPVPTISEMAFASGVPGIRNKAFEAVLEQNKNRGDLGLGSVNPRDFTTASLKEYARLIQSGAPKAEALGVLERTVERRDFPGDDGRVYTGAFYADGRLRDQTISTNDPIFRANAEAKVAANIALTSTLPNMERALFKADEILNKVMTPNNGITLGTPFAVILSDSSIKAGTAQYAFANDLKQLMNMTFISGREGLKGSGSITDFEGIKAESAINNMELGLNPEQFKEATLQFMAALEAAKSRVILQSQKGLLEPKDIENNYERELAILREKYGGNATGVGGAGGGGNTVKIDLTQGT